MRFSFVYNHFGTNIAVTSLCNGREGSNKKSGFLLIQNHQSDTNPIISQLKSA